MRVESHRVGNAANNRKYGNPNSHIACRSNSHIVLCAITLKLTHCYLLHCPVLNLSLPTCRSAIAPARLLLLHNLSRRDAVEHRVSADGGREDAG